MGFTAVIQSKTVSWLRWTDLDRQCSGLQINYIVVFFWKIR